MKLLQLTMDLEDVPTMPKLNSAKDKNPPPSEEAIELVKKNVPKDMWLYEYAKRLFEARWDYFNGKGSYIHPQLPPLPDFDD